MTLVATASARGARPPRERTRLRVPASCEYRPALSTNTHTLKASATDTGTTAAQPRLDPVNRATMAEPATSERAVRCHAKAVRSLEIPESLAAPLAEPTAHQTYKPTTTRANAVTAMTTVKIAPRPKVGRGRE